MTPTASILAAAAAQKIITDSDGRRLAVRRLTALDKLRLFKAAGPDLARNDVWLGMAMLACSVTAIDDVPLPMPLSENLIEAAVQRLGDAGITAVADALSAFTAAEQGTDPGN
jgi:hypothetical protein